jgi:DNA-binding transcriptional LysR family regulator
VGGRNQRHAGIRADDLGPESVRGCGRLWTASGEVLRDWVRAGEGLALKAQWDIEDDLKSGALVECLAEHHCDVIELYAVFANRRHLAPRVRAFLDFVVQRFTR